LKENIKFCIVEFKIILFKIFIDIYISSMI